MYLGIVDVSLSTCVLVQDYSTVWSLGNRVSKGKVQSRRKNRPLAVRSEPQPVGAEGQSLEFIVQRVCQWL